jgi:antitoxin (DNA-binding transcriptional repressor) of toxin-antitoxin stability system
MRKVGIRVLKNKLSEYVRLAAEGETIAITDRDRIVAQLTPPEPDLRKMSHEERWAEMVRRGIVTPATRPKPPLPPRRPVVSFEQLMKDLDEDRQDRW